MAYFESAQFCDQSEYERWRSDRVDAHSLISDEHYQMMLLLTKSTSTSPPMQAAKLAVRILTTRDFSDVQIIRFAIVDDDFRPVPKLESLRALFQDGYWVDAHTLVLAGIAAKCAYLKALPGIPDWPEEAWQATLDIEAQMYASVGQD